ncbi:hypothetical protein GCM10008932_14100 [Alkalibacterium iburiense]|uniref:Uncharacterized protein n=1 Tax=Alkalibacterium iburiense TaxID=290589 RepID=A0ABP3H5T8_9LACT
MPLSHLFLPTPFFSKSTPLTFSNENKPYVVYEYGSYGPDLTYNLYSTHITLFKDSKGTVSTPINTSIGIDREAPRIVNFEVPAEDLEVLQVLVEASDFYSLPKDLSNVGSMDGGYTFLTIYAKGKKKRVGGSNPFDETFKNITDYLDQIVPDSVLRQFNEGIRHYQREMGVCDE